MTMGVAQRFVELDGAGAPLKPAPAQAVARLEPERGLMWGPTLDRQMTWDEAKKACEEFRMFGFSDWRLPTVEELFGLADRSRKDPAIDTGAFPDTRSSWYWSASPWAGSPASAAWIVGFNYGYASDGHHGYKCFVRPVRSAAVPGQ
jgi:hypothetical protein